jgi:predicted nucleic acid-binding protein
MNGGGRFFVDTNVLLYSVDSSAPEKNRLAWEWLGPLWEEGQGRVSWQVLHEFYSNAVGKLRLGRPEMRRVVRGYAEWEPVETTLVLLERAWHWMDEAQVAYWDGLIVAAERAGCGWLLSEDFQAGQRFGPVTVVNPFVQKPADFQGLRRRG